MLPSRLFADDFWNDFEKPVKLDRMMKCDVYEEDNKYVIEMDVPGIKKEDLNLDLENGYLTISYKSEKKEESKDKKKYIQRERHSYSSCTRQFYVGDIDENSIEATFKDGVLTVTVPQEEKVTTKKAININ